MKLEKNLEDYIFDKSTLPGPINSALKNKAFESFDMPQMICGELESSFLKFLVALIKPKRILEIGTYVGYSALAMSENLKEGSELITLEIDIKALNFAKSFWDQTEHGKKIKPILGDATQTINELTGEFDLIFIDADKTNYPYYFKRALELLSDKGAIVVDNVLWSGNVLKDDVDDDTQKIKELNEIIKNDHTIVKTLIPIRDGVFLITKK